MLAENSRVTAERLTEAEEAAAAARVVELAEQANIDYLNDFLHYRTLSIGRSWGKHSLIN